MLSVTFDRMDGSKTGSHPLVKSSLRDIYNRRPPQPKYGYTWDVQVISVYIAILGPSEELDLKTLTCMCAALMVLTTLLRTSELASIDRTSVTISETDATFSLSRLRKTQRTGPLRVV